MTLTLKGLQPITRVDFSELLRQVDVSSFAGGDGSSGNPWTAWDTEITWASDTVYNFRFGYYSYATWPSAINALHRVSWIGEGMGHTFLKYTGTGNAIDYQSSVLLPVCHSQFEKFSLHGNASAKKGIVLSDAHHSIVREINVRSFSEHGFLFKGCVLNNYYDIRCSRQSEPAGDFTPSPAIGIELSNNGAQLSSVNVFHNPIVEFVETCFLITNAWNTTVIGGSMEGLGGADPDSPLYGFFIGAGADTTTIIGGDHEGCTIANLRIQGGARNTLCLNSYFPGGLVDIVSAENTKLIGGLYDDVTVGVNGGVVELDCEITGTYTQSGAAADRYRARILTAQPVSGVGNVALQLYNGAGGNLWRVRQTAASDDLRISFESLAGVLTDFLTFSSVTGKATFGDALSTSAISNFFKGADVASAATIAATGNLFHVTGTTTITSVSGTGITAGTEITIIFDGALTFTDGSNLKLAGNFATAAESTITLRYDGSNWYEVGRSPAPVGGAWASWTPTWTNLTLGNGTVVAKYSQIGNLVTCRLSLVFGSTTSVSGSVSFSLPVTRAAIAGTAGVTPLGQCRLFDTSGGVTNDGVIVTTSTTTALLTVNNSAATYLTAVALSSTIPFTWAVGDEIAAQFTFEAA